MSPRLIVFCDGTWNSRGDTRSDATPTNVWRLYSAIESADVADQKGLYLHGVGSGWSSSIGKLWAALNKLTGGSLDPIFGGASGWGLSRQVREGYSFLVREYQPGDEIYIFGFSRGAFAARSLVGLLKHAGLLRRDSAHEIRRVTKSYHRLLRGRRHKALLASLRERTHYPVRVRFLGVWDTVGALGAPIWGGSFSLNPLPVAPRYHDVNALDIVDQTFHAVAIDEKRATYAPVLFEGHSWNESSRLEQVWFRGVHSDVGGGYTQSGLADVTLDEMKERASKAGLRIAPSPPVACRPEMVLHDSLGAFWVAGVWPRSFPFARSLEDPAHDPSWGFLDRSVNNCVVSGDQRSPGTPWLIELSPGQATSPIEVVANDYWTNTRVILRKGAEYRVHAAGHWTVRGRSCGAPGRDNVLAWRRRLRAPHASLGELIALVNAPSGNESPSGGVWDALLYLLWQDPPQLIRVLESWGSKDGHHGSRIFRPFRTGVFHCFANSTWYEQHRNVGAIRIVIERIR